MVNGLDKLVSEVIQELDYDLWKEMYVEPSDDGIDLRTVVRDLIEDWYYSTMEKEYG